jgi:ParB-like chromosome segregation protein Spo0J
MAKNTKITEVDGIQIYCGHDKLVAPDKLTPHPKNPNVHPDHQITALAKVLQGNGWRSPITVSNLSGNVVRGHGRLMAAQRLGMTQVPVDYQDYANEQAELADLVADNTIPELAHLDQDMLKDIVSLLDESQFDLTLTGIHEEALESMLDDFVDPGIPEELPTPPIEGEDNRTQSFILVYTSEEERQALIEYLGIDGHKTMYMASEVLGEK